MPDGVHEGTHAAAQGEVHEGMLGGMQEGTPVEAMSRLVHPLVLWCGGSAHGTSSSLCLGCSYIVDLLTLASIA